jgi:hypothetical protein
MKLSKLGVASTSVIACVLVLGLKVWDSRASTQPASVAVRTKGSTPEVLAGSTNESIDRAFARRKQRMKQLASAGRADQPGTLPVDWEKYEAELEDTDFDDRDPLEQVKEEVTLLERQRPMEFMQAFFGPSGRTEVDPVTRAAAERHVGQYVEARTALLKKMYVDYVEDPFYEPQRDVSVLAELDDAFERDVTVLREKVPGIEGIPTVFRETALPPPFFAKDAWNELRPPAAKQELVATPEQEATGQVSAQEPDAAPLN